MLNVHPVHAFRDNYIWVIHTDRHAVVIDPGIADPVLQYLQSEKLQLIAILNTHHHSDHTGGNIELCNRFDVPVYGPSIESIPALTQPVKEGDTIHLKELSLNMTVLDTPGHTIGHISFFSSGNIKILFCGDTLFACGCGRIFEGTAEQMYHSLLKLTNLPDETLLYCAHEYTMGNIQFAKHVEPGNTLLLEIENTVKEQRSHNTPTLPTTIAREKAINPFLRCQYPEVINSACLYAKKKLPDPVSVFSTLREWKNNF